MKKQIRIAIHGKLGSGKSTFLELAKNLFPELYFEEEKFAKYMYEVLFQTQLLLGLPIHKDGEFLQFIGSHYKKIYGNDFWIDRTIYRKGNNTILTDLRFPEEFDACKKQGYTLIKIFREDGLRYESIGNRDPNHISETALDRKPNSSFDYIINNNGNLEGLEGAVARIIEELK